MNVIDLAQQLLTPQERDALHSSMDLLEAGEYAAFYRENAEIVQGILSAEDLEEFLDFSSEDELDPECFCAAFLCSKRYGIQVGGYEEDLTQVLTDFFQEKGAGSSEILEIIGRETIFTDCDGCDNFKDSMSAVNRALAPHGLRLLVLEDCVYCGCEYTLLLLDQELPDSWESENFSVFLS